MAEYHLLTVWRIEAPLARAIFIRNHAQIMAQGGKALARLLKAPLVVQENIDLMALVVNPGARRPSAPETSRVDVP